MVNVSTEPRPSERVVEQRMRNRAMEALETLAAGDDGVRSIGVVEYVEEFFDIIDDRSPWQWRDMSVFTPDEVEALGQVHDLLVQACDATPQTATPGGIFVRAEEDFIDSGWPSRIEPAARKALDMMTNRGRFSEEDEEIEPGGSAKKTRRSNRAPPISRCRGTYRSSAGPRTWAAVRRTSSTARNAAVPHGRSAR
jgi:hypothetical protein